MNRMILFLAAAAACLMLAACEDPHAQLREHLDQARVHYTESRLEAAVTEVGRALRIDPDHLEALYLAGLVQEKRHHLRQAFWHYLHALRLNPAHDAARARAGSILLLSGDLDKARA